MIFQVKKWFKFGPCGSATEPPQYLCLRPATYQLPNVRNKLPLLSSGSSSIKWAWVRAHIGSVQPWWPRAGQKSNNSGDSFGDSFILYVCVCIWVCVCVYIYYVFQKCKKCLFNVLLLCHIWKYVCMHAFNKLIYYVLKLLLNCVMLVWPLPVPCHDGVGCVWLSICVRDCPANVFPPTMFLLCLWSSSPEPKIDSAKRRLIRQSNPFVSWQIKVLGLYARPYSTLSHTIQLEHTSYNSAHLWRPAVISPKARERADLGGEWTRGISPQHPYEPRLVSGG